MTLIVWLCNPPRPGGVAGPEGGVAAPKDEVRGVTEAGMPAPDPQNWLWGFGCIMLPNCAAPRGGAVCDAPEDWGCIIEPMGRPEEDPAPKYVGGDVVLPVGPLADPFEGVGVPGSIIDPNWGCGCDDVGNGEDTSEGRVAVLMGGGC